MGLFKTSKDLSSDIETLKAVYADLVKTNTAWNKTKIRTVLTYTRMNDTQKKAAKAGVIEIIDRQNTRPWKKLCQALPRCQPQRPRALAL